MARSYRCQSCGEAFESWPCYRCHEKGRQIGSRCRECHNEVAHDVMPDVGILQDTERPLAENLVERQRRKLK